MKREIILPAEVEAFISAFKSIGQGTLSEEAARSLQQAIKATVMEQKKSIVTIKLHIKHNVEDQIVIEGEVSATVPKPKSTAAFFVDTRTFLPTRNRPNQQVLPIDQ